VEDQEIAQPLQAAEKAKPAMPPPPSAKSKDPVDLKVMANARGYFAQDRKVPGDKFVCPKWSQLGDWMTIENPALEKRHQEEILARNRKINSAVD
jgi:hypothetical protein